MTADLPFLIILTGPGFVALQVRAWAGEAYRLSDFQRLVWSVFASAAVFIIFHGIVRHFPFKFGTIASPETLLGNPAATPLGFVVGLISPGLSLAMLQRASWTAHG